MAGVGIGLYSSFEEAVSRTIKITREHVPNKDNCTVFDRQYGKYRKIYEGLKDIMKEYI